MHACLTGLTRSAWTADLHTESTVVPVAAELSLSLTISPPPGALELAFVKLIMEEDGLEIFPYDPYEYEYGGFVDEDGLRIEQYNPYGYGRRRRRRKVYFLPVEIFSEIFLLVSKFPGDKRWNWRVLMLVCRRWHAIILSTPGLHSQLRIRRASQ